MNNPWHYADSVMKVAIKQNTGCDHDEDHLDNTQTVPSSRDRPRDHLEASLY
jgi:hypothetical protein